MESGSDSDSEDSKLSRQVPLRQMSVFHMPSFDCSTWNPQGPAGLNYVSLVPFTPSSSHSQDSQFGKIKISSTHRKQRLKEFQSGRTTCRNIVDERRLRNACNDNDCITVIELLDGGADASCEDLKGRTPLHIAASQGHEQIVKVLLDHGANPNKKDFIGNTPLHLAASTCQIAVVTLLLVAGTDLKLVDNYGRTPIRLARTSLQRIVRENKACESMRKEMKEVSEMMSTYLRLSGQTVEAEEIDSLCLKLEKTTTREEVDHVNSLMANFAELNIQKHCT
ncbi:Ankyrin repeat domain-containing protein 54 [Mactra antiquata]